MNIADKLKIIQKISGLTQTDLANRLEVSFPSLNSWWHEKSQPRLKKQVLIDDLYKDLTGQKIIPDSVLLAKKTFIEQASKKYHNILSDIITKPDIYQQFILSLTYNSNKIEGSTLSESQTADIMFNRQTIYSKTLTEHLEATNHQAALKYLFNYLSRDGVIGKELILKLHAILLNGIREDAGFWRNHGVRIVGANLPTANYLKIPIFIDDLIKEISEKNKDIVALVARVHAKFEQIHPFSDGNGRVGRLLIIAMLLKAKIAPAIIREDLKRSYYNYLNKAQIKQEFSQLEDFICDAVSFGFDILERKL
jgi:Fic family protein